jgi:hypothetical protein
MRCINTLCSTETSYFRIGSVHCIDRSQESRTEMRGEQRQLVWLCPQCSHTFVVQTWRAPGQQLRVRTAPTPPSVAVVA